MEFCSYKFVRSVHHDNKTTIKLLCLWPPNWCYRRYKTVHWLIFYNLRVQNCQNIHLPLGRESCSLVRMVTTLLMDSFFSINCKSLIQPRRESKLEANWKSWRPSCYLFGFVTMDTVVWKNWRVLHCGTGNWGKRPGYEFQGTPGVS